MTDPNLRISMVTPSLNQARFLRAALDSVLNQGYANLEYVVCDGASTDGSAEIVGHYADQLAWWTSEPDAGQFDAINKGFARSNGEIMGWLNSDDMHLPWTLSVVAEIFDAIPEIEWLTTLFPLGFDAEGRAVRCAERGPYSPGEFFRGDNLPGLEWAATGWIQQESTFWRRSLWERAGGAVNANLAYAADFDLWARFFTTAELHAVAIPLAGFRHHADQKTAGTADGYKREARDVLARYGGRPRSRLGAALSQRIRATCPESLRGFGDKLGLLQRGPLVRFDTASEAWAIEER
jgi:glycosyltransferase involved in cell wall biosynthesis